MRGTASLLPGFIGSAAVADNTPAAIALAAGDLRITILPLGARLQSLHLEGIAQSLTLGSENATDYETALAYAGPIIGPVANRIGGASFRIGDQTYATDANEGGSTTLHGGAGNTHARLWSIADRADDSVSLRLDLSDGLGGFPGNRVICATWRISAPATLDLILTATSDADTPMNLAHHPFWCLDPTGGDSLRVLADTYLPTDAANLPTGEISPVNATPFDLRLSRALSDPDLPSLDTNYCLSMERTLRRRVATLTGANGVRMEIETTEPGLQVFTGFDQRAAGSNVPGRFVALEPQSWPDALNHANFPQIILRPGETYRQETRYVISRIR